MVNKTMLITAALTLAILAAAMRNPTAKKYITGV